MPSVPNIRAIATKESIATLWAMAEQQGEVTIRVASRHACYLIRNKLYKHRAYLRKQAQAHVGVEASHLDGFKITYREEDEATGKWFLTISYDDVVEFELILPDDFDLSTLPHFDTALAEDDDWKEIEDDAAIATAIGGLLDKHA